MSASPAASRPAKPFLLLFLCLMAVSLVAASCGSGNATTEAGQGEGEPSASSGQAAGCDNGAGPIAALLGSGLPTYDYDPAANLDELVASSDLVVSGLLHSAVRVPGPTDDAELEPVESQFTQLEAADWEVLSPGDGSADDMADVFLVDSWWAGGKGEDPLGSEVRFADAEVRYVAFLHVDADLPAPRVGVQGLVIGCDHAPAVPVIGPLPADGAGLSIADLKARLGDGDVGANPEVGSSGRGPSISVEHRLLADGLDDESMEPWSTAVLTADQAWDIDPDLEIDVDNDVILGFWLAESGSCPFSPMTDLRYDTEFQVIYPGVEDPSVDQDCTDDANAHLIIVAVPRSELPIGNLTLWVNGDEPRSDGATFVADGELTRPSDGALPGPVLGDDGDLAIGETKVALGLTTHCGLERLYWLIDGRQWLIADERGVPAEWNNEIRGEAIDLMVTLVSDDELEASTLGAVAPVLYEPAPDVEGCD